MSVCACVGGVTMLLCDHTCAVCLRLDGGCGVYGGGGGLWIMLEISSRFLSLSVQDLLGMLCVSFLPAIGSAGYSLWRSRWSKFFPLTKCKIQN